ncbi:MAG TPA: DUF4386 domain-containing protein [Verrucomicrobiae bacterium]|nr:DUF4386 domain-containing protein [Verrucomicrobiae bacterium]
MNRERKLSAALGIAFLFQATTSLISGMIPMSLIKPGNIDQSMINIAGHAGLMRANFVGDLITGVGVIALGVLLFVVLRKYGEIFALIALGCYLLEIALGAVSRIPAFALLRISQEYAANGHPEDLRTLGNLALETMNFGFGLLMLPFCIGAILFYYLLYKSRMIPRVLSVWGLVSVPVVLVATVLAISGYKVSFFVYIPYIPFEWVVGGWILFKGLADSARPERQPADRRASPVI